jgi:translocation and assembly module TamB
MPVPSQEETSTSSARPSRLRRFFLRHVPITVAVIVALVLLLATGLYFWMSSAQFENIARKRLIAELEKATGGRVEVATFHWRLLELEAEATGVVIHGTEARSDAPYVRVDRLRTSVSVLGFWSPNVELRDLEIEHPAIHLIVYHNGSTNQPHPRTPPTTATQKLNTFFDLQAGHIAVEQGTLDFDNRAASFDFQDRRLPLDFQANDLSVLLGYVPATTNSPETYRIQAGATDLSLVRGFPNVKSKTPIQPIRGYFQASLDLTRTAAMLNSFRLIARGVDGSSHALDVVGKMEDFTDPHWQARVIGDLDMRLIDPITGYPFTPEGIARLDLTCAGQAGEFRTDGNIHVDKGSYIGTGVVATGIVLNAHVHADPRRLLISSVLIHLRQGGQMEGSVDLTPWLPSVSGEATIQATHNSSTRKVPVADQIEIPVYGKVTAQLKDVTLDAILDMVSQQPFQRLGISTYLNGPAVATWNGGDVRTLSVAGKFAMRAPSQAPAGEAPAYGSVDGTYTQRNGGVDLRKLEVNLPASQLTAHGSLGAYPVASPTAITVDFHSHNLGEFDTVLRSLGLNRNGKSGTAALPIALTGEGDFHGTWTGSLVGPHLAGNLKATGIALEMPVSGNAAQSSSVHLDSVEATGSYAATHIEIAHALLLRGDTRVSLSGSLSAPTSESTAQFPGFDENSSVHAHVEAAHVSISDMQPFLSEQLPVSGTIDTQFQADGTLHSLGGSGWAQLNDGVLYGEPITHLRAEGTVDDSQIKLSSIALGEAAGNVTATGSYDLHSKRFSVNANGAGLDVSKIGWFQKKGWAAAGRLVFDLRGSGTFDDPELQGNATLSGLALGGEPVGALQLTAHTTNHALAYDMTTRLDATELTLHGQTALKPDYETQARLEFSQFNIDSILKLAHISGLSGQSALAGTITVEGPLAHPEQLRGEARLQELEATVAGVRLKSEGGIHATLANDRIQMDPLHVTGENTDLHAQGSLILNGTQRLDLAASGSVNLKLAETLDPDITASGISTFQLEAHGPLNNPGLQGRVDFENGALSFEDLPNGLSQLHGSLEFNRDRLEVKSLTAMSGGGPLTVGGYLAYQHGIFADLSVTGKGVRIRYPQGISSLADSTLHLQGSQNNLFLSGDALITRFTVSPDLDFAALAAQANAATAITPPEAPSNHIRLDVRIHSSPQLNFQNAFAKLAGDVDLRLRGTLATPALQGSISVTEGNAIIAGTRYELQRGDISFTNPVRIEPLIDLSATARVEDYDITLSLHGTPDKMSVTYRSDPPLPESDVVALLALGRTENQQRIYTQQQEQALSNPTTDALLGGALNATVSSRVQKLFGAGSVKVDPNYLGPFGNSTSRIIVEEQVGRNLTLTYATDVNTTGQQLLQAEVAINRHVSLLIARDESGVFSMVVKATRRFK